MTYEPRAVVETAFSILEFSGDIVRKRKRPMHARWIDWSTPRLRQLACANEVELNQPLAADVYLRVEDEFAPDGSLRDSVVVMRRLPAEQQLGRMIRTAMPLTDAVEALARTLSVFHAALPSDATIAISATPNALKDWWRATIDDFRSEPTTSLPLSEVLELALRFVDGCAPLFEERLHHGCIVDGHGDLGVDNVFLLDDGPRIIDRLDTNGWLRHGDVLQDLASLTLDLELMGAASEADHLRRTYSEMTAFVAPASLAHFYAAKRAVQLATSAWPIPKAPIERLLYAARDHLRAAAPEVWAIGGLPGTGKTTVADEVGDRISAVVLHEHEILREQEGIRDTVTLSANATSYAEMIRRARLAVSHGESVVLDADFSTEAQRSAAGAVAGLASFAFTEIELQCPSAAIADRFRQPPYVQSYDDITLEDVLAQRGRFDPWPSAHRVDTSGSVGDAADMVLAFVRSAPGPTVTKSR